MFSFINYLRFGIENPHDCACVTLAFCTVWLPYASIQLWLVSLSHCCLHLCTCERLYAFRTGGGSVCVSHSVVSDSVRSHGLQPTRLLCPWDSPGRNAGVGCCFLLQEGGGGKAKKLSCISYYLINRRIRLSFEFMIFYSLYTIGLENVNF